MLRVLIACSLLCVSNNAMAHAPKSGGSHSAKSTHHHAACNKARTGWVWHAGHWKYLKVRKGNHVVTRKWKWTPGHWQHHVHGRSYRSYGEGPPRIHHSSHWIPGRWVGHGPHRRWIPGRWS